MASTWQSLLEDHETTVTLPWIGGRELRSASQTWTIVGKLPAEFGWYTFQVNGRRATNPQARVDHANTTTARRPVRGYLVGNRLIPDGMTFDPDPTKIATFAETVYLIEDGLDRFARIVAARIYENGPLIFRHQDMPLGPEDAVLSAFLDGLPSVDHIKGVHVALDAAFRMEIWQREQAELRRIELTRQRAAEVERQRQLEAERALAERRQQIVQQLGDAVGRRSMVPLDFGEAARAALQISGAEYLDHRRAARNGETIVRFRLDGRRFECVCDARLRIVDAGICLAGADRECALETLPSVIREAIEEDVLVVYRHVD